jgi:excisionase family DNA binding protein
MTQQAQKTVADPLLTVREAAEYLSASPKTIYLWTYQRRLASCRLGRSVRFRLSDLDAFIAAGTTHARSEMR